MDEAADGTTLSNGQSVAWQTELDEDAGHAHGAPIAAGEPCGQALYRRPLRVLLDARPSTGPGTGISRYARSLARVVAQGVAGPDLRALELGLGAGAGPLAGRLGAEFDGPAEEALRLPALLEREGVDVFHSPLFHLPPVLPAGVRAIVTIHDAIPAVRPDLTSPGFARLFAAEAGSAARRAARVVCPSAHARDEVQRALGVPAERLRVVPEAPDPVFHRPEGARLAPQEQTALRAYGLEPGGFVLAVGSLERRKGPDLVLAAFARLGGTDAGTGAAGGASVLRCVFAGPAAGFDLQAEAARHGVADRVLALGHVPDETLVALYAGALALVFPSRHEGFGLPVVEAFAAGAPVVAARATSLPEVAGDAALLVAPEDPAALADAIARLVTSPALADDLRRRGRERLAACFTEGHVRASLAALYAELAPDARDDDLRDPPRDELLARPHAHEGPDALDHAQGERARTDPADGASARPPACPRPGPTWPQ